jgi:CBS domain-containing protein
MRMDHDRATRIAAAVGQAMALLFGLFGFATANLFLILISVFVWMGASGEGQQSSIREMLGSARASVAMTRQPWSLSPEFPLKRAVELTLSTPQSDFPVLDSSGRVIGLLTLGDLIEALHSRPSASVGEVMQREFPTTGPNEPITVVQEQLEGSKARVIPVVDDQHRLVGLLTRSDILELIALLSASR